MPAKQAEARKTAIVKRSVVVRGHKTSVSLEQPFWNGLRDFARLENLPVSALLMKIDGDRPANGNLSSAVRIFLLEHYRDRARAAAAVAAIGDGLQRPVLTNGDASKAAA